MPRNPNEEILSDLLKKLNDLKANVQRSKKTFHSNLGNLLELIEKIERQQDSMEHLITQTINTVAEFSTKDVSKKPMLISFLNEATQKTELHLKLLAMLQQLKISAGTNNFLSTLSKYKNPQTGSTLTNRELIDEISAYLQNHTHLVNTIEFQEDLSFLIQQLTITSSNKQTMVNNLLIEIQRTIVNNINSNSNSNHEADLAINHKEICSDLLRLFLDHQQSQLKEDFLTQLNQSVDLYELIQDPNPNNHQIFDAKIKDGNKIIIDNQNINNLRDFFQILQQKNISAEQFYFIFHHLQATNLVGFLIHQFSFKTVPGNNGYTYVLHINPNGTVDLSLHDSVIQLVRHGSQELKKYHMEATGKFNLQNGNLDFKVKFEAATEDNTKIFDYSKIKSRFTKSLPSVTNIPPVQTSNSNFHG